MLTHKVRSWIIQNLFSRPDTKNIFFILKLGFKYELNLGTTAVKRVITRSTYYVIFEWYPSCYGADFDFSPQMQELKDKTINIVQDGSSKIIPLYSSQGHGF